jgi:hypothetical protein
MSKKTVSKPESSAKVGVTKSLTYVNANRYELHSRALNVTYGASGADGKPYLNYADSKVSKVFKGDEIRVIQNTDLATLVSVTLVMTVDTGSTSFTILLPRAKMMQTPGASAVISTVGITTIHRFSLIPLIGQSDHYTRVALTGKATFESYTLA